MNDKVILACGSSLGEISMYYIEWDETDPDYGKNCKKGKPDNYKFHSFVFPSFNFFDKGPKMGFRSGGNLHTEESEMKKKKRKTK
mgnify:CR=1 FL=1